MPSLIEDYALLGDCHTAALVARDGSIDWLCFPRLDSPACFAALLGTPDHGRWQIAPRQPATVTRRYQPGTLILETDFETESGAVRVIDFLPMYRSHRGVVRIVEGLRGVVPMQTELVVRFDYGADVPWVRNIDGVLTLVAGPDALRLTCPVEMRGEDFRSVGRFNVAAGQRIPFVLAWSLSHEMASPRLNPEAAYQETHRWWQAWSRGCTYQGPWREAVLRSLITLKALTYLPSGGIAAAATTSLPEALGGSRNWDYRFCWLRDATFTLAALLESGFTNEALAWRDWLLRAVAGKPQQVQTLYGLTGQRRLTEIELEWLPGYEGAKPVRTGNAAHRQFQLDVFGELMDALHLVRAAGHDVNENAWRVQRVIMEHLEEVWEQPDDSIWEIRNQRRQFTHSKVMAWVAMDRAVKAVEQFGAQGDVEKWRQLRATIHDEVCQRGYSLELGSFVQSYDSPNLDAALLMIPLVGFLPAGDARVRGTVAAIEKRLLRDGLVRRYDDTQNVDGLPPGESTFLMCSFWLADNYALAGRMTDAQALFERLLDLRNDVGLLAEQYDTRRKRFTGNFPQAFSHIALVNSAHHLGKAAGTPPTRASS